MCGIAGFFAKAPVVPFETLEAMTRALTHRGPDDQGFFGVGEGGREKEWKTAGGGAMPLNVGLGSRRLAILDLSPNGAQPMRTRDGRYSLAFNGQIYNYIELRKELGDHRFRSSSDTEVLLELWARHGASCLERLDGMFAFAVWDRDRKELTLARDPLGIKPLYYFQDERGFFFGSEIRALRPAMTKAPAPRVELFARHFLSGWLADPDTLWEGVRRLEPGHLLRIEAGGAAGGNIEKRQWWDYRLEPDDSVPAREWVDLLEGALDVAVRRQLRSDVPVGFFLSGGVDSSLLAAMAARIDGIRPATFTTGFRWPGTNREDADLRAARIVARRLGFEHRELTVEPSVGAILPRVVDALEEPVGDPAALCSYLLCEAASERFKVLISGQGSDELFGGYPVYQAGAVATALAATPAIGRWLKKAADEVPYAVAGRPVPWVHRARKITSAAAEEWPGPFVWLRSPFRRDQFESLLVPELMARQEDPLARHRALSLASRDAERFARAMVLDTKTYLPANNLFYSDKTSMAHSVELRVPFLDREVIEIARRMPSRAKLDWWRAKISVKAVARRYLPARIVHRPKAGFGLPIAHWFRTELQPMAHDLLAADRLRRQGWLRPESPAQWLEEHRTLKADHGMKLFTLLTFQLWIDAISAPPRGS